MNIFRELHVLGDKRNIWLDICYGKLKGEYGPIMDTDLVEQAEAWLKQLYEDLIESRTYEKSNEELDDRVAREIRLYAPELQQAIRAVLGKWLASGDIHYGQTSLGLILRLKATEFIPKLEQLREDILAGRPNLPTQWVSTVDGILRVLREAKSEETGD
ncbi:MAG: hypothetical protein ABFD64_10175 [Armatimonadota bacterium]